MPNRDIIESKIKFDEPMKKYTSFKIGGPADIFIKVTNLLELKDAIKYAKQKKLQVTIIGNGSNILITDKGIRGIVIKIDIQNIKIEKEEKNVLVTVGAGNKLMALANKMKDEGLSGLEELAGIPRKPRRSRVYECWSLWKRNEGYSNFYNMYGLRRKYNRINK